MAAKQGVSHLRDDSPVSHTVIRIHSEESCAGRPTLQVVEPELQGDAAQLQRVLAALKPQVDRAFETDTPMGGWLRAFRIGEGDAEMQLAPNLACMGLSVATMAFDTMRRLLPDTDIYVGEAQDR